MIEPWSLKRTRQCRNCPWRVGSNPLAIPGYSPDQHAGLTSTIAREGDLGTVARLNYMACHETEDAMCVGWVDQQLGPGNNIGLRMRMSSCTNAHQLTTYGAQHDRFEDTLPKNGRGKPPSTVTQDKRKEG